MTEQVKVSWKLGNLEMQYEGNEEFLKSGFSQLFQDLLEIYKSGPKNGDFVSPELSRATENPIVDTPKKLELSVNSIATKLGFTEGKGFVIAACAYLALGEQKATFSRDEIREAMKTSNHFYNETQRKNLSHNIASLMKDGDLLERSKWIYALHGDKLKELQNILGN